MYKKTVWVNDSLPAINASNLNKIEQGIYDSNNNVDELQSKNKWDSAEIVANKDKKVDFSNILPAGTYTFSCDLEVTSSGDYGRGFLFVLYDSTKNEYTTQQYLTSGHNSITFTTTKDSYAYRLYRGESYSYNSMCKLTNIQLEEGTTETSYKEKKYYGYESGSNDNGSWIKYDDGTMICWKKLNGNININIAWGSLYYNEVELGNSPLSFIENPTISYNLTGENCFVCGTSKITSMTDLGRVTLVRPTQLNNMPYTINVIAIGRWK